MCLLLVQDFTKHKRLTRTMFSRIWSANPHGGGVGYYTDRKLPTIMVSMNENQHWLNYEAACNEMDRLKKAGKKWLHLIVHFRVSTQGSRSLNNCHPFYIHGEGPGGAILAHNGCTGHPGVIAPEDWSDTRTLAQEWIPYQAPQWWKPKHAKKIEEAIGHSRVVILSKEHLQMFKFPAQRNDLAEHGYFSNYGFQTEDWSSSGRWNNHGYTANTLSNEDSDRLIAYCLAHNLSLAEFLMMCDEIMRKKFPTVTDFGRFMGKYKGVLATMQMNHDYPKPPNIAQLKEMPIPEDCEAMAEYWLIRQGLKRWAKGVTTGESAKKMRQILTDLDENEEKVRELESQSAPKDDEEPETKTDKDIQKEAQEEMEQVAREMEESFTGEQTSRGHIGFGI